MEREVVLTGIGGQGVQFAAQLIAQAAVREGRSVLMFGSYGGMMRGGNTDATVVVADRTIEAPPTVSAAWAGVVMHHDYWSSVERQMRPGSLVFCNSTVFRGELDRNAWIVFDIPVTDLAVDLGNIMTASVVMTGALAATTGLVSLDALVAVVPEVLPPYRVKHVEINQRALRAGFDAAVANSHPAWPAEVAA